MFAGPELPYTLVSGRMVTSPDGGGVILFGGGSLKHDATYLDLPKSADKILELRYGSDRWTELSQKLTNNGQDGIVVLPFYSGEWK